MVVVYTITVATTSWVEADKAPLLLGTAGEFPPDWIGVAVGLTVHFVQTVMTLVLTTVDVVKPVVTIWLPPDVIVDVNGQTVV